jgi:imidazolonepropionase-like amidohydrolase
MRRLLCAIGLVLGLPLLVRSGLPQQSGLALVGGTIYVSPSDAPIVDGVLLIRDRKISAVGPRRAVQVPRGTPTLDCRGLIITAGFWNSHVHFIERKWANARNIPAAELGVQLQEMLTRFGVTSVFDTGSDWQNTRTIRDRIEAGEVAGPKIRSTGAILYPKGVADTADAQLQILGLMKLSSPEINDAAEGRAEAKKLLDAGTDGIKLYAVPFFAPTISMPESAIAAASAEAHGRGKLAFAHPTNRQGLLASVNNGVDIIVHTTPQSGPWDDTVLSVMRQRKVALIPTLKLWRYELRHDGALLREQFTQTGVGQLRRWVAAGGVVLFGTDVGYMSDYDPSEEYALMGEAGMSFRQILASLTTAPAERFGESNQRGRIAVEMAADLTVMGENRAKDVRAFASVRYTIRDGNVIWRAKDSRPR